MKKIKIDNIQIGNGEPVYTIAEAGANHEGNVKKAFKLIDAAIEGNANSIKFQTYKASKLTTKTAKKYWDDGISNETQYDVFEKLDMNYEDHVTHDEKFLRPEELTDLKGDSTKLRTTLGWKPTYTFETMLDEMIEHWL